MPASVDCRSRHVSVGGARLWVEERGVGAPIVLMHETGFDRRMWTPQITAFARDYRVIVYDQRGHGRSDPCGPQPYAPVADLAVLAAKLDPDCVVSSALEAERHGLWSSLWQIRHA